MKFTIEFLKIFRRMLMLTFPIWGVMLLAIFCLGLAFSAAERISVGDAQYFAFITATTVGYGDIVPVNSVGKFISVVLALLGILTTGIIVAIALQAVRIASEKMFGVSLQQGNKFP